MMVKAVTKTKTSPKSSQVALHKTVSVERFQDQYQKRLNAIEDWQRETKANIAATTHELERLASIVNFHAKAVAENASQNAKLDSTLLAAVKNIDLLKTWKIDAVNTLKTIVKDELAQQQLKTPEKRGITSQDVARINGLVETYNQKIDSLADRTVRIERKYLFPDKDVFAETSVIGESITTLEQKADDHAVRIKELEELDKKIRQEIKTIIANIEEIHAKPMTSD
jgi:hypothetical protein